jgi:aryl-alcohol dehydrogenase-like predicted oxidoreductase
MSTVVKPLGAAQRRSSAPGLAYERMVTDGDVLYAGSSNYSGWGLAKRQMQAWQRGFVGFVSEQTQCNLLSRVPELEVLPAAQDFGSGAIIYMPLAGGLLTGKTESLDGSRTRQVEREYGIRIGPENRQFQNFSQLCRELGEPEHVVATAWVSSTRRRFGHRRRSDRRSARWARSGCRTEAR